MLQSLMRRRLGITSTLHRISNSFCFNDTATTEIYTLSLHDALPISPLRTLHRRRSGQCPGIPGVFCWGPPGRDCCKTLKSRLPGAPRRTTDSRARSYRTHRDPAPSPAFHRSADSSPPSFLATWPRRSASASRRYARSTAPSVDVESPHRDVPEKYAPDDRTRDDHQSASTEAAPPSLTPACSAEATAAASGQSPRWIPRTGRHTSGGLCAGGSAWQECIRTLR